MKRGSIVLSSRRVSLDGGMPANCRSANALALGNLIGLDAADFVLLDADPLEDISNTRRIHCRFSPRSILLKRRTPDDEGTLEIQNIAWIP